MHDSTHHLRLALAIHEESLPPEGVARSPFAQVDWYTMKYSAEHAAERSFTVLYLAGTVNKLGERNARRGSECLVRSIDRNGPYGRLEGASQGEMVES